MNRVMWVTAALAALAGLHCNKPREESGEAPAASASVEVPARPSSMVDSKPGDAVHGKELVDKLECNRCHGGLGSKPEPAKDCVGCHVDIVAGKPIGSAEALRRWKPLVAPLTETPSLTAVDARFSRRWVEGYLLKPHDLRPALVATMPRLELSKQDARDLAAYLVPTEDTTARAIQGNPNKGRALLEGKGCMSCHAMTGVPPLMVSAVPVRIDSKTMLRGKQLAPDLRYTRDRMSVGKLQAWLRDPQAVKADTTMPSIPLSAEEINDLSAYLLSAELAPSVTNGAFARLPLLERKVTFDEVDKRVFHRTCWHCHSDADFSIGDGGPGNTGGFGFPARGLNLASYEGVAAGVKDKQSGARKSVLSAGAKGSDAELPVLVRSLLARHAEEAGADTGEIRGMPMGMPPLPAEDIQLIESWIAQGRPR